MRQAIIRVLLTGLAATAAVALSPADAQATTAGSLAVSPPTGTLDTPMYVETDGPCSGGPLFHIFVTGAGLDPQDNFITGSTAMAGLPRTSNHAIYAPLSVTFRDFFGDHHVASPVGRYTLTLRCRAELDLTSLGDFTAQVDLDKAGHYRAIGDAARPVTKPDDGGLLGPNNPLLTTTAPSTAASPAAALAPAPAPIASSGRGLDLSVLGGIAALVLILSALMFFVSRRRPRTDIRPDAHNEQRKVLL